MVRIQFKVPLTPTLKVKEFLVSLSKDPLTVITPELLRIVKTLPVYIIIVTSRQNMSVY